MVRTYVFSFLKTRKACCTPTARRGLCLCGLLLLSIHLSAQEPADLDFEQVYTLSGTYPLMATDRLQQLYLADSTYHIRKFDKQGRLLFDYSNRALGAPSRIDPFDPFEVVVFYPDFGTILVLDRTLNELYRVNLQDFGYFGIEAVARASDKNIWLFQPLAFQLEKINSQGEPLLQSRVLNEVLPAAPSRIVEKDQFVYLQVPEHGLFVFDTFGQFVLQIREPGSNEFQVSGQQIFYLKEHQLFSFQLNLLEERSIPLPADLQAPIGAFSLQGQRLYLATPKQLFVFKENH
ncbi:MAG: hypothetical protein KDC44_03640 [Phaeodactylibacter sp.]|nr:hypothetical protein [Phaeodactylibacter sp.]